MLNESRAFCSAGMTSAKPASVSSSIRPISNVATTVQEREELEREVTQEMSAKYQFLMFLNFMMKYDNRE